MNSFDFDQTHAAVRNELDRLIEWAAARTDLGTQTATIETTGLIGVSTSPLTWAPILAEAVTRLALAKQAAR